MDQNTVTTEGRTIGEAIRKASEQLGVSAEQIRHKIDVSHFKNEEGRSRPVESVKVICWAADAGDTAGAAAAKAYLEGLIEAMSLKGTVKTRIAGDKRASVAIDSEDARFLVGRGGCTLNAIRRLLKEAMLAEHADWSFSIDVDGGERRDDERRTRGRDDRDDRDDRGDRGRARGRDDRGGGRDRDDRGGGRDRDDRGRGRDRDDRGGGRDRDDRGGRRSERDVEDLKRWARKLAERIADEGGEEILRKPLNSFERRVVHMEIADMEGVDTATIEVDGERKVRIFSEAGASA
jgi:predicted RNA-binding protein Jag